MLADDINEEQGPKFVRCDMVDGKFRTEQNVVHQPISVDTFDDTGSSSQHINSQCFLALLRIHWPF